MILSKLYEYDAVGASWSGMCLDSAWADTKADIQSRVHKAVLQAAWASLECLAASVGCIAAARHHRPQKR